MLKIEAGKEYIGIVLPDKDPQNRGRYKVHIPELMPHLPQTQGIWVRNHVHKWRLTRDYHQGSYGQYYPLHSDTVVIVKFFKDDDPNSGYIDRVLFDYTKDQFLKSPYYEDPGNSEDRDDTYVIFKTPKYDNVFIIHEDTKEHKNTIWLIYNRGRTFLRISETGLEIYTNDNKRVYVKGDTDTIIDGNANLHITGKTSIRTANEVHIKSDALITVDAPTIHLNCDDASPTEAKKVDNSDVNIPKDMSKLGRKYELFE